MSAQRRPLIAGNWKMNGLRETAIPLVGELATKMNTAAPTSFDMLVCPPATMIDAVADVAYETDLAVGGQDCHMAESGAHTGDISAQMLKDLGCSYVIVGHSERRADHGEMDDVVCAKAEAAQAAGLIAVVCVGETETERDKGITIDVVAAQISGSVPPDSNAVNVVVAYEPVWAIGTGVTAQEDQVQAAHATVRQILADQFDENDSVPVLYGGSVKPDNAEALIQVPGVNGFLIGGASLDAASFTSIANSVEQVQMRKL